MNELETPTTEAPQKSMSLLAAEMFGSEFKGEVKQPEPRQEDPAPDAEQPEYTPEVVEQESTEEPITNIEQLSQKYSLDPEFLQSLEIPVKINGQEGKAKLADLTKSYQITSAAEQRLEESKQKVKAENAAIAEKRTQLDNQYAIVAGLIDQAEKTLTVDEKAIDWAKLREQDPAEWSAKKAEIAERRASINAMKQNAVSSYQSTQQQGLKEAQENYQSYLREQHEVLLSKLPEWKDQKVAGEEKKAISSYLMDQGFTKEDISAAADHRLIVMARKAMLFDKGQNKAEAVKKKVVNIPKVLKPGAPKSQDQAHREAIEKAQQKLKKSGSVEDALAVMRLKRGN